jgi:hypothetical protein
MNVQYELPYDDSVHPWVVRVDATSHDQIALLDPKQDQHIVGIEDIRGKEAVLLRDLHIEWEAVDFLEETFAARITSKVDAQNAIAILRAHHSILVCDTDIRHLLIKWEYAVLPFGGPPNHAVIDDLGRDGWEMVAVDQGIAYFKRPKA